MAACHDAVRSSYVMIFWPSCLDSRGCRYAVKTFFCRSCCCCCGAEDDMMADGAAAADGCWLENGGTAEATKGSLLFHRVAESRVNR